MGVANTPAERKRLAKRSEMMTLRVTIFSYKDLSFSSGREIEYGGKSAEREREVT